MKTNAHLQAPRPVGYLPSMLAATIAGGVLIAAGALTAALGGTEAPALNWTMGGSETQIAVTQGPAPTAPLVPSAVPKHVQSWKCWDIFTSQC